MNNIQKNVYCHNIYIIYKMKECVKSTQKYTKNTYKTGGFTAKSRKCAKNKLFIQKG